MARVLAFVPDLLFGSRVQADLRAAGHDVDLIGDPSRLSPALSEAKAQARATVLVVDLTIEPERSAALVDALRSEGALEGVRTLAFYSHVDGDARSRAESSGFDVIVPRSRMAREGADLVTRLAAGR